MGISNRSQRLLDQKATLYCTNCNHTSRINGDWIIHIHAASLDYECPRCGTTIDSRLEEADLTTQSDGALQFSDGPENI